MNRTLRLIGILGAAALVAPTAPPVRAQNPASLEAGFKNPPDSAKPRVWWHWMNGNVTPAGITADLDWMKRSGIGGMQMFDGSLGTPQFVDHRLVWMTPEWKAAMRQAAAEAGRLGLEMSMAASGGWSESGGPSVQPSQAMKKVVWSEVAVQGPQKFDSVLPHPPTVNGLFQNIPRPAPFHFPQATDLPGAKPEPKLPPPPPDPTYYADAKVLAYRVPADEVPMADLHPVVTSSAPNLDLSPLTDGDFNSVVALPVAEGADSSWIQVQFSRPFAAQAVTIGGQGGGQFGTPAIPSGKVEASQDGTNWVTLVNLPGPGHSFASFPVATYSFPPIAARFFRILIKPPQPSPLAALLHLPPQRAVYIAEVEFDTSPRVNRWQEKAAFGNMFEYQSVATPQVAESGIIPLNDVIDLTAKMQPDGRLDWDVPAGKWVILRMGYSLTGQKNAPASREATGYEVDKLSAKDVSAYFQYYVGQISDTLGPYFGKSFRYFLMDSWEAGLENWTDDMISEFRRRRGYDPTPYLPVLTGRVVESADASDRFLWDFRRTIADLLADNHYGLATKYFQQHGLQGLYAEAMGTDDPTTGDGLQDKSRVTIPMGEFWTPLPGEKDEATHTADIKEASSAAHVFGKNLAAAESFTTMPQVPMWGQSPFYLKPIADHAFAKGINRIVVHESAAQPFVDDQHKPGMTLGPFGQNYTRNMTWAGQAIAFNTYLARCSYLLQQGSFVGDLAYFYGEGAPIAVPFWKQVKPASPAGYDYDWIDSEALLSMSVENGRLVLPSGMSYRVLVLPADVNRLTLPVVRKLRDLVAAGAVVVAPRPRNSPSLTGYPQADAEIRSLANAVWGASDGMSINEHVYGKGRVYWGKPLADILAAENTPPDFEYTRPNFGTRLVWIHRHLSDGELYFVANQNARSEDVETSFRVQGKSPELWFPDTAAIRPASYRIENGRTVVPLHLDPDGSVFVVFRHDATAPSRVVPAAVRADLATIPGPWQVQFPPHWGAPAQIRLEKLISWTQSADSGVKYFSGTAIYSKDFEVSRNWLRSGARLELDLGAVADVAEVSLNGKPVGGILWKPPFRADVTGVLKPGPNHLQIKVTNLWTNRVIGDMQPGQTKRYTFTDIRPFTANSPLPTSGLLGPVKLERVTTR